MRPRLVIYEEDQKRIAEACARLARESNARMVFVIDRAGQLIAQHGEVGDLDTTALASLAAGDIAATGGLARLLGEKEFPHLFHEGDSESIHLTLLGDRWILVVIFDERSSLGLVRLRVRKFGETLAAVAEEISSREPDENVVSPFADITDEDIDNLFADF